jgi:hypothetical protein
LTGKPPASPEDFVNGIPGFLDLEIAEQTQLLLFHHTEESGNPSATAAELNALRTRLKLREHAGLSVFLSRGSNGSSARFIKAKVGYALERKRAKEMEELYLGRRSAKVLARDLRADLSKVSDPNVSSYAEEAVTCFEMGFYRAAIVLSWVTAYAVFRHWLFKNHVAAFNAVSGTWKEPFVIKKEEDFQDITESKVINASKKAGVISKEQWKTLSGHLDDRNSFAHPTSKVISPAIAEAYLDVILKGILTDYL